MSTPLLRRTRRRTPIITGQLAEEFSDALERYARPGEVNGRPATVTDWSATGLQTWLANRGVEVSVPTVRRTLRRMGPLKQLLGLLPGVGSALKDVHIDDKQLDRVEAIVHSMTPGERKKPDTLDMSRRKRIARGSGTDPNEVGQLGKQFTTVNKLAKQMSNMSAMSRVKAVKELGEGGMAEMLPGVGGLPGFGNMGKGKASSAGSGFKSRFKKRR